MNDPIPLILDVDTGVDDALAILYALGSPEVELVDATCVMGNVKVDRAVENTLAVLELAGRVDVEVAGGASRPLVRDHEPFPVVHGERGLGRAELPPPSAAPSARSAVEVIVETARARPGQMLLVATGPLTNVALALREEPELPRLLRGFAVMGGAYARGGNTTPPAEANVWVDPDAAAEVFHAWSGLPEAQLLLGVGLDVTERVTMNRADLDAVCAPAPGSALAHFLQSAVSHYIEFYERTRGLAGAAMHDPLAVALAIDPGLASFTTTRVEVERGGTWTRGMTVADLDGIRRSPWPMDWAQEDNARVALEVDGEAFMARFVDRLRGLVDASS